MGKKSKETTAENYPRLKKDINPHIHKSLMNKKDKHVQQSQIVENQRESLSSSKKKTTDHVQNKIINDSFHQK